MNKQEILDKIKNGLIVSCQALEDEPLHSSYIMSRMAFAAMEGGACGIRANSVEDIREIKKTVSLPVIGIIKTVFDDSDVYITSTAEDVEKLIECKADVIAIDATDRLRHGKKTLDEIFIPLREKYPEAVFMADCSCFEDGEHALKIGFDILGTTLAGYTEKTKGRELPDFELMSRFANELGATVIAEGGIWTPEQLKKAFECGAHAAVIGTAITRPREITKRFVNAIK